MDSHLNAGQEQPGVPAALVDGLDEIGEGLEQLRIDIVELHERLLTNANFGVKLK